MSKPLVEVNRELKPECALLQHPSWTLGPSSTILPLSEPMSHWIGCGHLFSRPLNSNTGSRPAHVGFCCQKLPAIFHTLAKQPAATTTTTKRLDTFCAARSPSASPATTRSICRQLPARRTAPTDDPYCPVDVLPRAPTRLRSPLLDSPRPVTASSCHSPPSPASPDHIRRPPSGYLVELAFEAVDTPTDDYYSAPCAARRR